MRQLLGWIGLCVVSGLLVACGDDPVAVDGSAPDADVDGGIPDGGPPPPAEDPRVDQLEDLLGRSDGPVGFSARAGFPTGITGRFAASGASPVERARSFLAENAALFLLDDERITLEVVRSTSGRPMDRVLFRQRIDGIPVLGGGLGVLLEGSTIVAVYGNLLPSRGLALRPGLTPAQALERAVRSPDDLLSGEPTLAIDAPSLLGRQMREEPPRLVYRVALPRGRVLVDARSGEILREVAHEDRALGLDVFWRGPADPVEVLQSDETGCVSPLGCAAPVTQVRDAFTAAYGWYAAELGWVGHDGNDGHHRAVARNHSGGFTGLVWDLFYGDVFNFTSMDLDSRGARNLVGHEWFHSVVNHTSDLDPSQPETSGIEEALASWMGSLLAFSYAPGSGSCVYDDGAWYPSSSAAHEYTGVLSAALCGTWNGLSPLEAIAFLPRLIFEANQAASAGVDLPMLKMLMTSQAYALRSDPADPYREHCLVEEAFRSVGVLEGVALLDGHALCPEIDDFADVDEDFVEDVVDNCTGVANHWQADQDFDGLGDLCDPDLDGDGFTNEDDNCPTVANPDQDDTDGVGGGDACDGDDDGDLLADADDNCPAEPNPGQEDGDGDGEGDACDPDADGDGTPDDSDACPFLASADEGDADLDGLGDACDPCPDDPSPAIGYTAGVPALGVPPAAILPDLDADGIPDACDPQPLFGSVTIDGVPYAPTSLTPGRAHHLEVSGAVRPVPLPLACARCPGDFDESFVIELLASGLPVGTRLHVFSESGAPRSSADTDDLGTATLRWVPRGGERAWLFVAPPRGVVDLDFTLAPTEPSSHAAGDCEGARDGAPCVERGAVGTCEAAACVPSRCGDGVLDRDEVCDDGNAEAGDGCEPTSCGWSCAMPTDCDDGNPCTTDACVAEHRCESAPRPGGVCTTATGATGTCSVTGLCTAPGCGNATVDAGEECDDGDAMVGDGCDPDCTWSCESAADCDDSDVCTGTESCALAAHTCSSGGALDCDDGSPCTADSCDRSAGCASALVDADRDGHAPSALGACGDDCDDTNARVSPDDPEVCNGVDDDCDGTTDEGLALTCYRDADGDGAGTSGASMSSCGCPAGWSSVGGDCHDGDRSVGPITGTYRPTPYCGEGASCPPTPASYDYDCSGGEEPQWVGLLETCPTRGCAASGWMGGAVPACGASGRYLTCTLVGGRCSSGFETRRQACR